MRANTYASDNYVSQSSPLPRSSLGPRIIAAHYRHGGSLPARAVYGVLSYHQRIIRRMECARRAVNFYELAIDRVDGKWAGRGEAGSRFRSPQHPYADDLDLFIPGGLFEALSSARTRAGENTLASWLLRPAPMDASQARHQSIAELHGKIDLREDLFVLGEDFSAGVNPDALAAWAVRPLVCTSGLQRWIVAAMGALGLTLLGFLIVSEFLGLWQRIAMMLLILVNLGVMYGFRHIVEQVTGGLEQPAQDLALFSSVLARIEREQFTSPLLTRLRSDLSTKGDPASRRIARLNRLVELIDSRDNFSCVCSSLLFYGVLNWFLPRKHGARVPARSSRAGLRRPGRSKRWHRSRATPSNIRAIRFPNSWNPVRYSTLKRWRIRCSPPACPMMSASIRPSRCYL